MINRFLMGKKPSEKLEEVLKKHSLQFSSIHQLKKFPSYFSYLDWSFGFEAEEEYYYKITYEDKGIEKTVLSMITVLFGVFILKIKFFKDTGKKVIPISIENRNLS